MKEFVMKVIGNMECHDIVSSDRLYANVEELYDTNPEEEEDPYSYGNESIYDSICYYQAQVRGTGGGGSCL